MKSGNSIYEVLELFISQFATMLSDNSRPDVKNNDLAG